MVRHLPNLLSAARIPASLALLVVYDPQSPIRTWVSLSLIIAIMASDFLDGRLARKYALSSKLGYLLDGLGDRAFHVSAYLLFFMHDIISVLLLWILIFREISQYAVRLIEPAWHATQSKLDRRITRGYAVVVQALMVVQAGAVLALGDTLPDQYVVAANVALITAAALSYARIIPRLSSAWKSATSA